MTRFEARGYDGLSSRAVPVELCFYPDGRVTIRSAQSETELQLADLTPGTRIAGAPRRIGLPGGASLELPDSDALDRCLAPARPASAGWVARLEARAWTVALALAATIGCLLVSVSVGIPTLARLAARALPPGLEQELGDRALETLDEQIFSVSETPPEEQQRIEAIFARLRTSLADESAREAATRLVLRGGGLLGANAFALPSGLVVVTDELLEQLEEDDELAAVLAHELGHLRHRHGLRLLLQNLGVGVLVAGALGDFVSISSLAASVPTVLLQLQYSRSFELEADDFALDLLEHAGLPPRALAGALERMTTFRGEAPDRLAYFSTHPATAQRIERIEARDGR